MIMEFKGKLLLTMGMLVQSLVGEDVWPVYGNWCQPSIMRNVGVYRFIRYFWCTKPTKAAGLNVLITYHPKTGSSVNKPVLAVSS